VHWAGARVIAKGGSSDTRPPAAPVNLRVADAGHNSVRLEWTAATDNVGVRGYDIYCGTINVGSCPSPGFQVTGLDANTSYTFTVRAWDRDGNTSPASAATEVTTPLAPELAYLSQLNWKSATTDFGSVSKDRSVNGKPIQLGGVRYERGLGTHAASEIVYDLGKLGRTYTRFVSDVGVDDEVSQNATVVFQVFADEKKVFDSGTMRPESDTKRVDVSIAGVRQLRLVVTDAGDGINSDHADWADARLESKAKEGQP
jgi:chitodextrinase